MNAMALLRITVMVKACWVIASLDLFDARSVGWAQDREADQEQWIKEFLNSFNRSSDKSFKELANRTGNRAEYLKTLHMEFGPLVFKKKYQGALWCKGKVSQGWVGFVIRKNQTTGQWTISGVRRGISLSTKDDLPDPKQDITRYVARYLEATSDAGHFSGGVAISKNGQLLFSGSYGFENRSQTLKASKNSKYWLASAAKPFSAVAVGMLVDDQKLQFDDTIDRWIPEYPTAIAAKVTIGHLLTHTSGIELDHHQGFMNDLAKARDLDELLKIHVRHIDQLRNFQNGVYRVPGQFDYTNEGLDLLGIVIQRASGMPWAEFMEKRIFEPCKMKNTGVAKISDQVVGLASSYTIPQQPGDWGLNRVKRREVSIESRTGSPVAGPARPAGSIYSTAEDMNRFGSAVVQGDLLSKDTQKQILTRHVAIRAPGPASRHCAYLFQFAKQNELETFGHTGGAPGMSTVFEIYPDQGYVVSVLSNFDRSSARNVAEHIKELIRAKYGIAS